jgi:hypothetical protein
MGPDRDSTVWPLETLISNLLDALTPGASCRIGNGVEDAFPKQESYH